MGTLVETLVGLTLGLVVVALAGVATAAQLDDSRRLLRETELQQDLRGALDVIARELRRSGHWGAAEAGVWSGAAPPRANPYAALDAEGSEVRLRHSLDAEHGEAENHAVDGHDLSGFRLRGGAIDLLLGDGNWQQLTDPTTLCITALSLRLEQQALSLAADCVQPCSADCPVLQLREFVVEVAGVAAHDAAVERRLQTRVRLPNDAVSGACPV